MGKVYGYIRVSSAEQSGDRQRLALEREEPNNLGKVVAVWERKEIDFNTALEQTGLRLATFYRRLKIYREEKMTKNNYQKVCFLIVNHCLSR